MLRFAFAAMMSLTFAGAMATRSEAAAVPYTAGHADFGGGWEEDHLELHVHGHVGTIVDGAPLTTDTEFPLDEIYVVVPEEAKATRLAGGEWNFLGVNAGEKYFILPQTNVPNRPFFGLGAHGPEDTFVNDTYTFELTSYSGPGDFSLYFVDPIDLTPDVLLATSDGVDPAFDRYTASFPFGAEYHDHANWAFTEPGWYDLNFTVSGELLPALGGGTVSDTGTLRFHVVPEPATLALLASASAVFGLTLLRKQRRRAATCV